MAPMRTIMLLLERAYSDAWHAKHDAEEDGDLPAFLAADERLDQIKEAQKAISDMREFLSGES